MKAPELYDRLALLGKVASKKAISPVYRSLALTGETASAAAPWGVMRCLVELPLDREVRVDAEALLSVLHSLPETEFMLKLTEGALNWRCGPAKGHLTLLDPSTAIPEPQFSGDLGPIDADSFAAGLDKASLACGGAAVRSYGLESVQLQVQGEQTYAYASDSISFSSARLGAEVPMSGPVTLRPEAAGVLAAVVRAAASEVYVGADMGSLYCVAEDTELQLNQLTVQKRDLAQLLQPYTKHEVEMPLFTEAVQAFLKRAEALAEERQNAVVEISVNNGRTQLGFREISGSSEEYYDVTDAPKITVPAVKVEVRRLTRALNHANRLVFDYAKDNMLVLRGKDDFVFGLSGRR